MRLRLSILLALALGSSLCHAAPFEDPETGYRLTVPRGWRQHHDRARKALLLAGPGGLRVRVEVRTGSEPLDRNVVSAWYRSDGRRLRKASAGLRVTQKPELLEDKLLGGKPTWSYSLAYKGREGVYQSTAWVGGGPARQEGTQLYPRILAYGPGKRFSGQLDALRELVASFRYPEPEARPPTPEDPDPTVIAGDPGGSYTEPPERDEPDKEPRDTSRDTITSGKNFDNGSLRGGMGVMASGALIKDEKRLRAFGAASRVRGSTRTEQQRDQAAGYLGFGKE